MKSYASYKERIEGFRAVLDTVKSSEKIAASNIHFLKQDVSRLKDYNDAIEGILERMSFHSTNIFHPLLERRVGKRSLIIIAGEQGLVGGLWHSLVEVAITNLPKYDDITVIGRKGTEYLREEGVGLRKTYTIEKSIPEKVDVDHITVPFFTRFLNDNIAGADILFPAFVSMSVQKPRIVPFLPFTFFEKSREPNKENPQLKKYLPIFEPSKRLIFDSLLKKHISTYFFRIFLESKLSEFSARTVEMEHASEQTKIFIRKSRMEYYKGRRADMTNRQLEGFASHKKI